MIGYPFDSQVSYDEQGNPTYDRAISSLPLKKLISKLFTTGVMPNPSDNLQVFEGVSGMTVIVHPGFAVINGGLKLEESNRTLELQAADATYDRIDTVVMRWNDNEDARICDLYVLTGTPASTPVRPTLTRTASIYEIGLADIFIPRSVTTISQERITDTRLETERCGIVSSVSEWDTTTLYAQVQADLADFKSEEQAEFLAWFATIQDILDENVAAHLQNEINAMETQITNNLTMVDQYVVNPGDWHETQYMGEVVVASALVLGKNYPNPTFTGGVAACPIWDIKLLGPNGQVDGDNGASLLPKSVNYPFYESDAEVVKNIFWATFRETSFTLFAKEKVPDISVVVRVFNSSMREVPIPESKRIYLYNEGDECTSITGGWDNTGYVIKDKLTPSTFTMLAGTKETDNLFCPVDLTDNRKFYGFGTVNAIDISKMGLLFIEAEFEDGTTSGIQAWVSEAKDGSTHLQAWALCHGVADNAETHEGTLKVTYCFNLYAAYQGTGISTNYPKQKGTGSSPDTYPANAYINVTCNTGRFIGADEHLNAPAHVKKVWLM